MNNNSSSYNRRPSVNNPYASFTSTNSVQQIPQQHPHSSTPNTSSSSSYGDGGNIHRNNVRSVDHVNDLKDQVQALRQELMAKSESNFELNATIATMQAEMDHSIKTQKEESSRESSKLNHLLRLEQQKSQRLEQKQKQQHHLIIQHRQHHHNQQIQQAPQLKRSAAESIFAKRLSNTTAGTRHMTPSNLSPTALLPQSFPTTPGVTPHRNQSSNNTIKTTRKASRLAQHLLQETENIATGINKSNNSLKQVLMDIANDDQLWTEVKLIEFLIRHATSDFWYPALLMSCSGRHELIKALERGDRISVNKKPRRKLSSRITLGGTGTGYQPQEDELSSIAEALKDPWWNSQSTPDWKASVIPTPLVRDWLTKCLVVSTNTEIDKAKQHLQALNILLEECCDNHSNAVWWELCHLPMERIIEQIYQPCMRRGPSSSSHEPQQRPNDSRGIAVTSTKKNIPSHMRRLEVISNDSDYKPLLTEDLQSKELLAISLSIFGHLLQTTQIELLDEWYKEGGNGARIVSLVLDLFEEDFRSCAPTTVSQNVFTGRGVGEWYLNAVHFLNMVGKTRGGFDILRTRTRPAEADDNTIWLSNALHVSIQQLYSLAMGQEELSKSNDKTQTRRRTMAIEGWIRLWHQVLLVIQQQQQPEKQTVALSFRSLLLEHQNWYTSACAMLLANNETRREIQFMIRLQLEELSMDEEEHEELKE